MGADPQPEKIQTGYAALIVTARLLTVASSSTPSCCVAFLEWFFRCNSAHKEGIRS
jgi:hypothetical protein